MDLNDIRINHTGNSNDFMRNDDPVNPMNLFDISNMGQFNTENQISSEVENNNFYYQQENFLYFYINNKKSYDENEILVRKTYAEPYFLPLLETRREEGRIILVHERPYLSLTNFLQNNNLDNSLRFLLFKQGLHIIFKLISLDQDFSFFNYTIFFAEDYRDENEIDCLFYDFESTLRLKIYYHVEIEKYQKQHQLNSKHPYHWIFYLFCLIFKEFSIEYNKDKEKTNLLNNYDEFTISIMKTIFSFLCERITEDSYIQDCFEDFLNLLNPILKYHGIQEINQYDSNKEYFSYIDFRFDIDNFFYAKTLDFLTLPISLNKAVKLKRNIYYNSQAYKNSSENNDNIYLDYYKNIFKPQNICPWSDIGSQYLRKIFMHLSEKSNCDSSQYKLKLEDFSQNKLYNEENITYDPIKKNNNINAFSQPIQNDFFNLSKDISKNFNFNQNCSKNNVYNINNYFQVTNPRTNINVNGNLYNNNYNVNKHSKCNPYPNNYPFNICLNYRYPNENTFYNDNCIEQKLREYECQNNLYFPYYNFYNSSNNINLDNGYGLKKDFMCSPNQEKHYYSNNYHHDYNHSSRNNQPPTDGNDFLGNKRRSSDIGYFNSICHNNPPQNSNMNIFDKDDRLTRHALNESININLNLNENCNYQNNIYSNNNMISNSSFEYNNECVNKSVEDLGINISKNKDFPGFISDSNEILIDQNGKDKKDQISSVSSKNNKSFEIKKVEKISKMENKKQNKSKNIINIFNIENVPKSKKSNSLISMKFFNDKSFNNIEGSVDYINESSQSFYVRNNLTFKQTDDTKNEAPFDIKSEIKNLESGEIYDSIEKKISEIDEKKDYNNSSTKLKEYSDIINNIFNDHNKEKNGNYKDRLFPINGLYFGFYNNPDNSNDVGKINKNVNENSNKKENYKNNQSKINEKIRNPSTKNNLIFNITKKICMNNIRSRLGKIINFKRRKLSLENIRKKSKNKIRKLSNTIKENILNAETFQKEEKFQKALINMNEQKITLNKNILKNLFSSEEHYEFQESKFKKKEFPKINDEASPLEGKINLKTNGISQKYKMKSYTIKELRNALINNGKNQRRATDKPIIINQNNSNKKFKSHVENRRKKYHQLNKISRNLFKYKINVKGSFNKSVKNNKKEITNSISSSRRISRNSTNFTDNFKNSKKKSKIKLKNESKINCNLHFFEYLNDKNFSRNKIEINKNKKSEKLIGEKINLLRSEIDDHDKNYQRDLESKLLDKRHLFMKNNFPTLYEKENFYYMKKDDLNGILENHSNIPEMFDLKTIESYIRDIKDSILNVNNEKSDKIIWDSIITKYTLNKNYSNIEKNQNYTEDESNQNNKPLAKNDLTLNSKIDSNLNTINSKLKNPEVVIHADSLINSDIDIIKNGFTEIKIRKKEVIDFDKSEEEHLILNSNKIIDGNKTLFSEDKMKHQNQSEDLISQPEIERKKYNKLEFENPLALNRLWSPYVLNNDQILYYFEEARKMWPRYLNWSEEIALNLLNKFDYKIENTLNILRDPAKEILSYVKANLTNRLSLKSGWKNRSRASEDKKY